MRLSALKKAVDILARERFHGVLNISGGEPTLHPRVPEMVSYASKRLPGAKVVLFTNGHWVGRPHWRQRLRRLLAGENVLVRFSLDRQHAEGALRAANIILEKNRLKEIESSRLKKARLFFEACLAEGALPGLHFDFAFKGSEDEAREYMCELGDVPLYLIRFQKDPAHRAKKMGYFAIGIDENNRTLVYPTLGHIYPGEPLGGIENLPPALRMNRKALKAKGHV
jgi:uncharacterized Fe-S cluster-containing radical SAM superfamily protein